MAPFVGSPFFPAQQAQAAGARGGQRDCGSGGPARALGGPGCMGRGGGQGPAPIPVEGEGRVPITADRLLAAGVSVRRRRYWTIFSWLRSVFETEKGSSSSIKYS